MDKTTGEITSDEDGCFDWTINSFRKVWGAWDVKSPQFAFCLKTYELSLNMFEHLEVVEIIMTDIECKPMDNFYIELQLRTECNLASDLLKIVTHNTRFSNLRFYIDFRKFLIIGQLLSDHLTITLKLRTLRDSENLADESHSINRMQKDLKYLLDSGENSDVTLILGESQFRVHKYILSARSPVFKDILRCGSLTRDDLVLDKTDRCKIRLRVLDCDSDIFGDFLIYVYTGSTRHINNENVVRLYTTADSFKVVELKAACVSFMKANMSVEVFCSRAIFALQNKEKELIEHLKRFFGRKTLEIFETENWLSFLAQHPKEANDNFLKALAERH